MPIESPKSLYLEAEFNKTKAMCLIDTGSSKCLISESLYHRLKRKPRLGHTKFRFMMAQSSMESKGVCHLEVSFAGKRFTQLFFVVPMSNFDCIMGLDFISTHGIGILPGDMTLFFRDGVVVPLYRSKYFTNMAVKLHRKIHLSKDETKCIKVYGSDALSDLDSFDGSLYCNVATELWSQYGCVVHDGVVHKGRNNTFDLLIHNPTNSNVTIHDGTTIGYMDSYETLRDLPTYDPSSRTNIPKGDEEIIMAMEEACETQLREEQEFEDELDLVTPPEYNRSDQNLIPTDMIKNMLDSCKTALSSSEYDRADSLLNKYSDVFHPPDSKLSRTDAVEHYVELKPGHEKPVRFPPRRIAPGHKEIVEKAIDKMIQDEVISPSTSPWASPIVLVAKKNGETRFCVDYRKLNLATKLDAYPLPKIDDCIDAMQGAKYFCTLDLSSGYWQIKVAERDREKTAFTSHVGLFQFNVMPFGLTNAPATFQRMMDNVLHGLINKICLCYIDDIIIFGKTIEECMVNLETVLSKLKEKNLLLKPKKCEFFKTSVTFLGHVISAEGVKCDPVKCEKVSSWEKPKNISDIRSFLGLVGYYRRFIDNYSNLAKPLLQLTRKDVIFHWGPAHDAAFQALKDALCSDPILAYPVDGLPWILDTDASNYAIGAVLSQRHPDGKERVVCYGSKVLTDSQRNYCTTKRELFAVIYFVTTKFAYYLTNREFKLRTDHLALRWLMDSVSADHMCNRWLARLSPFRPRMQIDHRAGTKHGNADSMSRIAGCRPCARPDCEDCIKRRSIKKLDKKSEIVMQAAESYSNSFEKPIHMTKETWEKEKLHLQREYVAAASIDLAEDIDTNSSTLPRYSEQDVVKSQSEDDAIARVKQLLVEYPHERPSSKQLRGELEEVKQYCKVWADLRIEENILYRKDPNSSGLRLVAPKSLRKEILEELHDKPAGGHLGITRVRSALKQRFFWPRMRADIERWCQCCRTCSLNKKGPSRGKSPLIQEMIGSPWERVAFDIVGPLKQTARGNRFILTVVDYFTKWVEAYPLKEHTAKTVANTIVTEWVSRYGVPLHLHCDQAPEFESKVIADFCKMLGSTKTRTSPYHPIGNGLAERSNQTLESILKCTVNENKDNWDLELPFALMAYRATPSATTGCSPNLLVHGRETTLPIDIMYGGITPPARRHGVYRCYCDYVHDMQESMAAAFQRAKACSKVAAERYKRHYDVGTAYKKFYPGQFVLWMHKPTANKTLHSGWRPLVITRILNKVDVQCQESEDSRPITIHMDNVIPDPYKPFRTNWVKERLDRIPEPIIPTPVVEQTTIKTVPPQTEKVSDDNLGESNKETTPSPSNRDLSRDDELSEEVSTKDPAQRRSQVIQNDSKPSKKVTWKRVLEEVEEIPKRRRRNRRKANQPQAGPQVQPPPSGQRTTRFGRTVRDTQRYNPENWVR